MLNNTGYLYKISRGNIATAAKQHVPKSAPRRRLWRTLSGGFELHGFGRQMHSLDVRLQPCLNI